MSQGKGDTPRPSSVPRGTVEANYERTFTKRPAYEVSLIFIALPPVSTDRATGVVTGFEESMAALREHIASHHTPPPQAPDDEARAR